MKDENKTKELLMDELLKLRQRIAELERSETERKQMEKVLKESEEKLRIMFESIGDGIIVTDLEANIIEVNNATLRMGGYSDKEELIGRNAIDFVSPKDRSKAMENLSKEIEVGYSIEDVEYTLLAADGSEFLVESNATMLRDNVGSPVGLINIIRDITERKKAEETLKEKTAYLEQLFVSAQEGIIIADSNGKVIRANKEFLELFGYTPNELIGKSLDELVSSKGLYAKARSVTVDVARGEEVSFEAVCQRKDKKLIDVSVLASPIMIDGEVVAVYGIYRDITERKKAEEGLKSSEERLKILFEFAPDAYYLNDLKGKFIDGNMAAEKLTGYKRDELIGKSFLKLKLLSPKDIPKAAALLTKNALGKLTGPDEFILNREDGTQVPVEIRTFPVKIKGKTLVLSIARDITERKWAEEALRKSEEKYRSLFENMLNGFALHEIVLDKKGRPIDYVFLEINDSFERLTGLKRKNIIGKKVTKVLPGIEKDPADWIGRYGKVALTGKEIRFEQYAEPLNKCYSVLAFCLKKGTFATIFEDITERKQEEAIRNVLFNISKATPKTSSLDDLLATIHEEVGTLMDAKNFSVCLAHDTEKNLYTFPYYKDINPEDLVKPDEIYEITEGLTHHVLKTKKYFLGNKEELKKIGVIGTVPVSWLGVPLKTESGDVNGVVAMQSYEKEAYLEKDAQVLSIIASNIAGLLIYKKAEDQIKASLKEKEVLLQEIHHRVKNNMQIISSLIKLQSEHITDEKALETFKSTQDRVKSMALIHERLYRSKDFARVDFAEYVQSLTGHLINMYRIDPKAINLNVKIKDVFLDINTAIPCGLIINELVSNSLKHAFPNGKKGEIKISMRSLNKNEIELIVIDNGVSIPEDIDFRTTESLGLHLVTILAEDQLYGNIKLDRTKGTSFHIRLRVKQ